MSLLTLKLNRHKKCFEFELIRGMLDDTQNTTHKYLQQAMNRRAASASILQDAVIESESMG